MFFNHGLEYILYSSIVIKLIFTQIVKTVTLCSCLFLYFYWLAGSFFWESRNETSFATLCFIRVVLSSCLCACSSKIFNFSCF